MFGWVGQATNRNVVIYLAVVVALLLVTGLIVAIADPSAAPRHAIAKPRAAAQALGSGGRCAVRFIHS
jgi:hypothetical protein